jgi:hypothetical protein
MSIPVTAENSALHEELQILKQTTTATQHKIMELQKEQKKKEHEYKAAVEQSKKEILSLNRKITSLQQSSPLFDPAALRTPADCDNMEVKLSQVVAAVKQRKIALQQAETEGRGEHLCAECYDAGKEVAFTPCGHCSLCWKCYEKLGSGDTSTSSEGTTGKVCPICREKASGFMRLFFT